MFHFRSKSHKGSSDADGVLTRSDSGTGSDPVPLDPSAVRPADASWRKQSPDSPVCSAPGRCGGEEAGLRGLDVACSVSGTAVREPA